MSNLVNSLNTVCAELRSEKINTRNKAAEQLDAYLTSSKFDLLAQLKKTSEDDVSWTTIFKCTIDAAIKHALKLDESKESKSYQTMRNKNYLFNAIINKLINYNLEEKPNHLMSKSTLFNGFTEGFQCRAAVQHFNELFLNILNVGIYKSPAYLQELKPSEFSIILSYLFETNKGGDDVFRLNSLKTITRTIELAQCYTLINVDIMDYFPDVIHFSKNAPDDSHKADIIKLYYLIISQYSVDYHYTIANALQEILPELCSFYHYNLRPVTKDLLFKLIVISLRTMYPFIHEGNLSTIDLKLECTWPKTLKKLKTLMDFELAELKSVYYQNTRSENSSVIESFVQMSALIVFLVFWNNDDEKAPKKDDTSSKMSKLTDKLEIILNYLKPSEGNYNEMWLAILAELMMEIKTFIDVCNIHQLLLTLYKILQDYRNGKNLKNIRLCLNAILRKQNYLCSKKLLTKDYCQQIWMHITQFILADTSSNNAVIIEKQCLIQDLVFYRKLVGSHCTGLLTSFITNPINRRSECVTTIYFILKHANYLELDKTSDVITRCLQWLCSESDLNEAKTILMHISPVMPELIAKTCAVAAINLSNLLTVTSDQVMLPQHNHTDLLLFKYNRQFICVNQHGYTVKTFRNCSKTPLHYEQKNCLFQSNYELLMRLINFQTPQGTNIQDIIACLKSLLMMSLLMKSLLEYDIFDASTYTQCPLIKRMGLFLSHLEMQFKSNEPKDIEVSHLREILTLMKNIADSLIFNMLMLQYLEMQPLEEMIAFVCSTLNYSVKQSQIYRECNDWPFIENASLNVLATLCSSTTHLSDSFKSIEAHSFNLKVQAKSVIQIIKIFCNQCQCHNKISDWFVDKLKIIFQLHYTNIELIDEIITMIPAIFAYIQTNDEHIDDMLIAVYSLLKVSFRKSYPCKLIIKIIDSIRLIARECQNIFMLENFKNICLSVVKFLTINALEVQFTAINTITALMDKNWHKDISTNLEIFFRFCDDIYKAIEWKKLQVQSSNQDVMQNSIALNVQLLSSLITFSHFHRDAAFKQLTYVCAFYKITEADLKDIRKLDEYYNISQKKFIEHCIADAIHNWIKKTYPILKFPYYLGYETKHDFLKDNIEDIVFYLILYDNYKDLQKLQKYGTAEQLINTAAPLIQAILLYDKYETDRSSEIQTNMANILKLNINISGKIEWKTIYRLLKLLNDENHVKSITKISIFHQTPEGYNINYDTLQLILCDRSGKLCQLLQSNPLSLVNVLNAIKVDAKENIFALAKFHNFYRFFVLADLIICELKNATISNGCVAYFAGDILNYILSILKQEISLNLILFTLTCLERCLLKLFDINATYKVLNECFDGLCYGLFNITKKFNSPEIQEKISNIFENIIKRDDIFLQQHYRMLYEIPTNECLQKLQCTVLSEKFIEKEENLDWKIEFMNFVKNTNCTYDHLATLRKKIRTNKGKFNSDTTNVLYELMKQLLKVVQHSQHTATNLEALRCLGEIGPLHLSQATYYFKIESECQQELSITNTSDEFYEATYLTLQKLLQIFQGTTINTIIVDISQYLVNSINGAKLLAKFPYFCVFQSDIKNNYLNHINKMKTLDWVSAWTCAQCPEYSKWICQFVSHLFKQCGWIHFEQLATVDFFFAEKLIIPFTKTILHNVQSNIQRVIEMLEEFFVKFVNYHQTSKDSTENEVIYKEKRIVNVMLEICECIRLTNNWQLPLNLLNVAQACNFCQAYFLSILYLETWAIQEDLWGNSDLMNFKIITNDHFQRIAKRAYESIGCTDAICGFLNPLDSRCDYLNLTNNWPDIFIEATNINCPSFNDLYVSVLKRNGMHDFAELTTNNYKRDYEICWRLCRWDTPVEGHTKVDCLNDMEYEFQKHHFNALKCLYHREENNTLSAITKALHCILTILKGISVECLQSVYKYLTWLQFLQQIDEFCNIQFFKNNAVEAIFDKWQMETYNIDYGNFSCKEQILSHKLTLFEASGVRASRKIKEYYESDVVEKCLLNCIRQCKVAGQNNLAIRYISILKSKVLQDTNNRNNQPTKLSALLEDADICMKTGKHDIAKSLLRHTINNKEFKKYPEIVHAYQMYGEYLLETNTDTFQSVKTSYFERALGIIDNINHSKDIILQTFPKLFEIESFEDFHARFKRNIHKTIAKYADREYTQLNNYINSDQFRMKQSIIESNRKMVENVNIQKNDGDKTAGLTIMKRFTNLDKDEVHLIEHKRTISLCIAMEHFIKFCCLDTTVSSPIIYRIIALWFANQQNKDLQTLMETNLTTIPSYKFICGLNQITARLNSDNVEFTQMLFNIIVRCVQEHPHHALYKLYPFVYSHLDSAQSKADLRSKIACKIITKGTTKANEQIIKQLEIVIPALIQFANSSTKPNSNENTVQLSSKLRNLKNLDSVHCPTIELPISSTCTYNNTIHIIKWETQVSLVGGINAPKKLYCLCSDGNIRPQLLKGKDDLRQDAVMQQVFHGINHLLEKEPEAKERKLKLRTYKVVPLSMRSGILEWCQNTVPLGAYLCDAHIKYRPNDYPPKKCRTLSASHLKSDAQKRFEIYEHICKHIKPVFQYFFFERFLKPGDWFERRYAYANSVATTSIVGFILGIGDRHLNNILIDEQTAEVIHIDFGIAFEQGKVMPTPETVPFRLTRDIIAPMGITGPNGVYRISSEITLGMLRRHQDLITTILEVLLYDPLYIWKTLPQTTTTTTNESEEKNVLAQRALIVVQNKLDGKEKGNFNTVSVPTHVERLINEAVSTKNLCMLFPGWDPYL